MKKLLILLLLILSNFSLYAQEKVILKHALKLYDMLEVSLEISDKPNDNFNLIKIDTLIVKDGKGDILQKNFVNNTFTKANVLARYEVDEKKKIKNLDVSGVIKYFKPAKSENSYFDLGKIKNLQRHVNLIDKSITAKNPDIYFSIVDSVTIKKVFPDFKYRTRSSEAFKKLDFKSFDLIYAYKANNKQDFVVAVNGDIDPGFNSLTLSDKNTGIKYKLISIRREMPVSEKADIQIELMIENEKSIHLLPFDFKKVEPKE